MPPSSDSRKGFESGEQLERPPPRKPPFKFLVPLIYAPVLPLIRIGLRKQPVLRDRLFTVVLGAALLHGGYLVYPELANEAYTWFYKNISIITDLYDVESK